jgi:hypothetical protein
MTDVDLQFLARQGERVLDEMRKMRATLDAMRADADAAAAIVLRRSLMRLAAGRVRIELH